MTKSFVGATAALLILLGGCSSRPRSYAPVIAAPPSDQAALDAAVAECHQLYVAGKLDSAGRRASVGAAAGAGAATAAVGGATAAAVAGYGGIAVVGATIVLLPVAVIGGAIGMAKSKRAKKERKIQVAMTGCLAEAGYQVRDWNRLTKAEAKAQAAARPPAAPAN